MSVESDSPVEVRALVVDDSVDAATSLAYLLQILDCRTAVAFGGPMALRVAQLFRPAIVFLDLDMPGQDGFEVLAALRKDEGPVATALVVCLSGRSEDERRCLDAGFDRFVSKPIQPSVLHDLLVEARRRIAVAAAGGVPPGNGCSNEG